MSEFIRRKREPRNFPGRQFVFVKWSALPNATMNEDGEFSHPDLTRWYVKEYIGLNRGVGFAKSIYHINGKEFEL